MPVLCCAVLCAVLRKVPRRNRNRNRAAWLPACRGMAWPTGLRYTRTRPIRFVSFRTRMTSASARATRANKHVYFRAAPRRDSDCARTRTRTRSCCISQNCRAGAHGFPGRNSQSQAQRDSDSGVLCALSSLNPNLNEAEGRRAQVVT